MNCAADNILNMLSSDDEFALAKLLDGFGIAVERAAAANEPYMLLRQVINRLVRLTGIITMSQS
jgi:hypothetical protein